MTSEDVIIAEDADDVRDSIRSLLSWLQSEDIDVFHTYGSSEVGDLCLPYLPRRMPAVVSVHANTWGSLRLVAMNARHANAFICVNDIQARRLSRTGIAPRLTHVIPHGLAVPRNLSARVDTGCLRIAYIGALEEHKGSDLVIPIARRLKRGGIRFAWRVLGSGSRGPKMQEEARRAGLKELEFVGRVDPGEARAEMARAEVVVVPSYTESFCYTAAEAMAAGCAVVTSRLDGVTDRLVRHGENGALVRPGDVRGFAREIAELAFDPVRRGRYGQAAKAQIAEGFSLERMGGRYAEVLERVLTDADPRVPAHQVDSFRTPSLVAPSLLGRLPEAVKRPLLALASRCGFR